jgi:hypothetical protein
MLEPIATAIQIAEVRSLLHPIEIGSTGTAGFIRMATGGSVPFASGINLLRYFMVQGGQITRQTKKK